MRITGGTYKNRKLFVPEGQTIRPTTDRMRQSLFNVLAHASWAQDFDLNGAKVLDIFCGTGALGLEALSRGAAHCLFIDTDIHAAQRNTAFLNHEDFRIVRANALTFGKGRADIDLVFMDPPYHKDLIAPAIDNLIAQGWLADGCILVIEAEKNLTLTLPLEKLDQRGQASSEIHIFCYSHPS